MFRVRVGGANLELSALCWKQSPLHSGCLGVGRFLRHAAPALILARMARPASERATHAWLRDASGAGELLGTDFESVRLMQLRRASDVLAKHRKALETHLFERSMNLFGLRPTVTLESIWNRTFAGRKDSRLGRMRSGTCESARKRTASWSWSMASWETTRTAGSTGTSFRDSL